MTTPLGLVSGTGAVDTSRLSSKENLKQGAEQFEAIFVNMMLKSMRATKFADGLFDNSASEQFRDMQDETLAQKMAAATPLGIGEALTKFLSANHHELAQDPVKESQASAVTPDVSGGAA